MKSRDCVKHAMASVCCEKRVGGRVCVCVSESAAGGGGGVSQDPASHSLWSVLFTREREVTAPVGLGVGMRVCP